MKEQSIDMEKLKKKVARVCYLLKIRDLKPKEISHETIKKLKLG